MTSVFGMLMMYILALLSSDFEHATVLRHAFSKTLSLERVHPHSLSPTTFLLSPHFQLPPILENMSEGASLRSPSRAELTIFVAPKHMSSQRVKHLDSESYKMQLPATKYYAVCSPEGSFVTEDW